MAAVPNEAGAPAVEVKNLVKNYGKVCAVNGISFNIRAGEFLAIIGPSGCGKTTTLRMLAGLETPTSGDIIMTGKRVNDLKPWQRDTPLVWQNFALLPHLTVQKNVEFGLRMRKVAKAERAERAARALAMVGLETFGDRMPNQLSGGQKQRVGIARALVLNPSVLLLDEPMGALDAKIARTMQAELRRLHKELGITFVYVTHNQSEALAMADYVIVMDDGRIQQLGPPKEVYRKPQNHFVANFVGTNNVFSGKVVEEVADGLKVETSEGTFVIAAPPDREFKSGDAVAFVVNADRSILHSPTYSAANMVEGVVTAMEIVGSVATVYVRLPSGYEFRIQAGETETDQVACDIGDTVRGSWEPASAFIMPEV